jgi:hypothetical protein
VHPTMHRISVRGRVTPSALGCTGRMRSAVGAPETRLGLIPALSSPASNRNRRRSRQADEQETMP